MRSVIPKRSIFVIPFEERQILSERIYRNSQRLFENAIIHTPASVMFVVMFRGAVLVR